MPPFVLHLILLSYYPQETKKNTWQWKNEVGYCIISGKDGKILQRTGKIENKRKDELRRPVILIIAAKKEGEKGNKNS